LENQAFADENLFRDSAPLPRRAAVDNPNENPLGDPYYYVGEPDYGANTIKGCNDESTWSLDRLLEILCPNGC
jgi:hypothetical protein